MLNIGNILSIILMGILIIFQIIRFKKFGYQHDYLTLLILAIVIILNNLHMC